VRRILIVGATSAIAKETARCLANAETVLFLVARDATKLADVAQDLRGSGAARVDTAIMDACEWDRHESIVSQAVENMQGLDIALVAHGTLPDQRACELSFDVARHELDVNFLSVVSLLTVLANYFESTGAGTIAVLSSVAGDRGRQSNYVYGAAKGAITLVLQGLRNRLCRVGVKVVTIKLGRVDTPMTRSFEKGLTWAKPADVAPHICRAIARGTDVAYIPRYWRVMMLMLRAIPERYFKTLRL
jgi:short-subunit dehydrogenase